MNNHQIADHAKGKVKNVIFLDIDGVLNNKRSMTFGEPVDMACARNLRRICNYADADIVVSSTWRFGNSVYNLQEILYVVGINRVIGRTSSNSGYGLRGEEIQEWIDIYGCEKYIIIDDDDDMLDSQKDRCIFTNGQIGLTKEESTSAIKMFNPDVVFCSECDGYGRVAEYVKCLKCKNKGFL